MLYSIRAELDRYPLAAKRGRQARSGSISPASDMAKKVGVLDMHQATSDTPQTFVKKCIAAMLVRRLLAEWVVDKSIIRRIETKGSECLPDNLPVLAVRVKVSSKLKLNPSGYDVMTLQSYPEPNRESNKHPHEAFLRECIAVRKREKQ